MTEYLKPSFTVALGSKAYRDNWDAIFGKKVSAPKDEERKPELTCGECNDTGKVTFEDLQHGHALSGPCRHCTGPKKPVT